MNAGFTKTTILSCDRYRIAEVSTLYCGVVHVDTALRRMFSWPRASFPARLYRTFSQASNAHISPGLTRRLRIRSYVMPPAPQRPRSPLFCSAAREGIFILIALCFSISIRLSRFASSVGKLRSDRGTQSEFPQSPFLVSVPL